MTANIKIEYLQNKIKQLERMQSSTYNRTIKEIYDRHLEKYQKELDHIQGKKNA